VFCFIHGNLPGKNELAGKQDEKNNTQTMDHRVDFDPDLKNSRLQEISVEFPADKSNVSVIII